MYVWAVAQWLSAGLAQIPGDIGIAAEVEEEGEKDGDGKRWDGSKPKASHSEIPQQQETFCPDETPTRMH